MSLVLIVDDDANQSAALAALLRHNGHEAEHVASAKDAIACIKRGEPDLVLLDLSMPGVDGLDLLQALTSEPRFDAVRVAVYSGRTDPDAFVAAKRLGACDFILKGEDARETLGRILGLLTEIERERPMTQTPLQHVPTANHAIS